MRVLIVEDDMVIAGCLGPVVSEAGCALVGLAADRDTAIALIRTSDVDLALIDLHLVDGWTGIDVGRAALENEVAVVFTTANPSLLPSDLSGAMGLIEKPYDPHNVRAALQFIAARMAGESAGDPPRCLKLRADQTRREGRASHGAARASG